MVVLGSSGYAQKGLEGIIVETYYVSDQNDSTDIFSEQHLPVGSVTYRIFVDMAPEYKLQMVYGETGHILSVKSTEPFFNNFRGGQSTGDNISPLKLSKGTVALDSWITVGAASQDHFGVLKSNDPDGSIIGGSHNQGGSAQVEGGLLKNLTPAMGIALTESDGYAERKATKIIFFNLQPTAFQKLKNDGILETDNGVWGTMEGAEGITEENQVLIAQITTTGIISFELNLQLLAPYGGVERFLARNPEPIDFTHPDLIYPSIANTEN